MNHEALLNTLFEHLEKFFRTETVVGAPIQVGQVTLIPLIEVGFGAGVGGGSGKDSKGNDGAGGGTGTGAKISPNAVLVIRGDEVSLLNLKDKGSLGKVLEMVPDLIAKMPNCCGKKKDEPV